MLESGGRNGTEADLRQSTLSQGRGLGQETIVFRGLDFTGQAGAELVGDEMAGKCLNSKDIGLSTRGNVRFVGSKSLDGRRSS
jgi:hypothetical protein